MFLSCCALLSYACFKRAISHGHTHFKCTFIALKWICEIRLYFFFYHSELNRKKHQLTQYLILDGCEMMLNWWMNESQSCVCFWIVFMEIIHYHVYVDTETSFLCFHSFINETKWTLSSQIINPDYKQVVIIQFLIFCLKIS